FTVGARWLASGRAQRRLTERGRSVALFKDTSAPMIKTRRPKICVNSTPNFPAGTRLTNSTPMQVQRTLLPIRVPPTTGPTQPPWRGPKPRNSSVGIWLERAHGRQPLRLALDYCLLLQLGN